MSANPMEDPGATVDLLELVPDVERPRAAKKGKPPVKLIAGQSESLDTATTRLLLAAPDIDVTVTTDPSGAWHVDHVSPYDGTFAFGAAICGDPERTGFVYSVQGLILPGSAPVGTTGGDGSD